MLGHEGAKASIEFCAVDGTALSRALPKPLYILRDSERLHLL